MNRRKFLGLGLGAAAVAAIPSSLSAVDFRATKPAAWTAKKVDAGIQALYGSASTTNSGDIKVKAPNIAENGAVIPITFSTKIKAKTISVFQDANPESTVAVFTMHPKSLANKDFGIRIKMMKTGKVTVVVEGTDGKLYSASKDVKVTIGGCGG
jgi:sulfur-oxidizing protein SoxY